MIPPGLHWYVAFVKPYCEKKAAEWLSKQGVEHYLPIRREVHQWSDRKKVVECIVLPRLIFIRSEEAARVETIKPCPFIYGYMSSGCGGPYNPAIVRDAEMDAFKMMVGNSSSPVTVIQTEFKAGDRVKVVSGPLAGMECRLVNVNGRKCLASGVGILGTAVVELTTEELQPITENN